MEKTIDEWIKLGLRIRSLNAEIDRLKDLRHDLERHVVASITGQNQERQIIGRYEARVGYRRRYQYDIPIIRKILEPRRLFEQIISTRVRQDEFASVIATPGLLTDAEFEDMLGAVHILEAREVLHVKRNRSGEIS